MSYSFDPFTVQNRDVVMVDGIEFIVDVIDLGIYLTTVDSRVKEYNEDDGKHKQYSDYVKHVRHPNDNAVIQRAELKSILDLGTYTIS